MAGELNFTAGINLDKSALARLEQEIRGVIKRIETDGTLIEKAFSDSINAVSGTAEKASKGLEKGTKSARDMATELDNATMSADELKDAIGKELSDKLNNLASMAAKFGMAFGAEELIRKIINVRGEFQQLEIAFSTMLGSKEKANTLMQELTATAAKTPFDMQGIAQGAKQLLAYGTASEDVNSTLVHLGDIAAGLSIPLNDLVYLYGTTMAQGQMFTQDLKQMQGRGIPIADEIAKILDVSKEAVPAMVSAGKVTADVFQKAILAMSSEGGKFYNLMEAQSKSLIGKISNLEDAFSQLLNNLGKETEGVLSSGISAVSTLVEGLGKIAPILMDMVAVYGSYKTAVIAVNTVTKAQASIDAMVLAGKAANATATKGQIVLTTLLTKAQNALNKSMLTNPWVLAATAIVAVGVALYKLSNAEKAEEKGIRKAREEHQKYRNQLQEDVNSAKTYISTIQDRTRSINEQADAWDNLNKSTSAFKGFSFKEVQAMSDTQIDDILKKHNEQKINEYENEEIRKSEERIASLQQIANIQYKKGPRDSYEAERRAKLKKWAKDEIALERAHLEELKKIQKERIEALNTPIDESKLVKNKEYWEKQKADAEESRNALDISEKGGTEWNRLTEDIKKAEEALQAWNDDEEKNLNLQKQLQAIQEETDKDIADIQYNMKLDALKKELEYTNDINKKLEIQKQINDHILEQKIKEHNAETDRTIKNTISEEDYAKYKSDDATVRDSMSEESKNAVSVINEASLREENAIRAQYEREANEQLLEMRVDAYRRYAEEVLRIEQEKADRIKEINKNEEITGIEKSAQTQLVEDNADKEKKLLSASTGIGGDIVAEVEKLVNDIMQYSAEEIIAQLEIINEEINNRIAEFESSLNGDITPEERAEKEKNISALKTKQNLLTKKGTDLIKKEGKEIGKVEKDTKKSGKTWKDTAEEIGSMGSAFGAVGDTADMVLNEVGGTLSGTAKDALQAVSGIASFAQGAFDLITKTAEITDTTSKSIMASNIIGWIMMAVQLLVKLGTFLAQYSAENQLKAEIEELGEAIEYAELMFENLEKKTKLQGNVGSKALKDQIMLAEEMNDTIDLQNEKYVLTLQLLELQRQKYGEDSEKFKETQKELAELEGEKYDTLQDQADRYQEVFEELATTDVTSFAEDMAESMVDGFAEGLRGMEQAYDETINNLIKEQLTKQLSLELIDKMKPAFDKLKQSAKDGELSTAEIDEFKTMIDSTKESGMAIADKYRELMGSYGLLDDAELEAESRGFEAMSQDTADELNGRFTALQMSGANIDQNTLLMTQQNVELLNHSRSIAEQATISTQIAQQQLYELREIKDNTAVLHSLDDRLRNIESYTSKL